MRLGEEREVNELLGSGGGGREGEAASASGASRAAALSLSLRWVCSAAACVRTVRPVSEPRKGGARIEVLLQNGRFNFSV